LILVKKMLKNHSFQVRNLCSVCHWHHIVGCVIYDNITELKSVQCTTVWIMCVLQCVLCVYHSVDCVCTTVILNVGLYRLNELLHWSISYIFCLSHTMTPKIVYSWGWFC
jgi:hypothetical protein